MTLRISRRDFVKITGIALALSSIPVSISVASSNTITRRYPDEAKLHLWVR